jgi:hypothetical protein
MPLVTVAFAPHPHEDSLLQAVADAVAQALGLADGDVIAAAVPVRSMVASGGTTSAPSWAIVTIHGSHRGETAMQEAMTGAERAILEWGTRHRVNIEGAWTEWVRPLVS